MAVVPASPRALAHVAEGASRGLEPASLNELSRWSRWPERLLASDGTPQVVRTVESVAREYDGEKYAGALDWRREHGATTPHEVLYRANDPGETVCVSFGNELALTTFADAFDRQLRLMVETMRAEIAAAGAVVELGCAYGYFLWELERAFPGRRFLGGEYSENAVRLAGELYPADGPVSVRRFDYYSARDYDLIAAAAESGDVVVFTSHSIEQLPSAAHVPELLAPYRRSIRSVFHFEPVHELYDASLMGLLRSRYAEVNDYNVDLLTALEARDDVTIESVTPNVFGRNPLNPTSIVHWRFA